MKIMAKKFDNQCFNLDFQDSESQLQIQGLELFLIIIIKQDLNIQKLAKKFDFTFWNLCRRNFWANPKLDWVYGYIGY